MVKPGGCTEPRDKGWVCKLRLMTFSATRHHTGSVCAASSSTPRPPSPTRSSF